MVDYIDRRSGEAVEDGVESATIPLRLPGGVCHREPARTPPRPRQTRRHTDTTRITPTALKASTGAANDDRPRRPGEPDPRPAGPAPSHSRSNPEPPHSRARRVSASLWAVAAWESAALLEAFPASASDADAGPESRRLAICQRFAQQNFQAQPVCLAGRPTGGMTWPGSRSTIISTITRKS